jgi:hypothetical protein
VSGTGSLGEVSFDTVQELPQYCRLSSDNAPNQYFGLEHCALGQVQAKGCAPDQLIFYGGHREISRGG